MTLIWWSECKCKLSNCYDTAPRHRPHGSRLAPRRTYKLTLGIVRLVQDLHHLMQIMLYNLFHDLMRYTVGFMIALPVCKLRVVMTPCSSSGEYSPCLTGKQQTENQHI